MATDQPQQSGGFGGALKAKLGPLPTWAWLAIITVVLLGYWLYEQHKNASSASSTAGGAGSSGTPGVVVINQDEGGTEPPPPPKGHKPPKEPKPRHKKHNPPDATREITLSKNETLAQLARQRHWSKATEKAVENENIDQGHGKLDPNTELHKGEEIVRPLG